MCALSPSFVVGNDSVLIRFSEKDIFSSLPTTVKSSSDPSFSPLFSCFLKSSSYCCRASLFWLLSLLSDGDVVYLISLNSRCGCGSSSISNCLDVTRCDWTRLFSEARSDSNSGKSSPITVNSSLTNYSMKACVYFLYLSSRFTFVACTKISLAEILTSLAIWSASAIFSAMSAWICLLVTSYVSYDLCCSASFIFFTSLPSILLVILT